MKIYLQKLNGYNILEIRIELNADNQLNRVNFTETKTNTLIFHDMATNLEKCVTKHITIHYKESFIFKKILIDMKYKILPQKDDYGIYCI